MTDARPEAEVITPSQTVGPFFAYCLTPQDYGGDPLCDGMIADEGAPGTRIRIEGAVYDGNGDPVPDAMVEAWQADAEGRFAGRDAAPSNARFRGIGRCESRQDGSFRFETVKPGSVPGPDGTPQAPHINLNVFAKGLLRHLFTRIYFADEPANAADPILGLVDPDLRYTLIARPAPDAPGLYRFDIRLQGKDETVFFEA
ncbi:protocatechuate 3,4-dioxygenase subunit alpha [Propylenella binzhouense]|uniref:Protocatechuate 3,4-dioxygenase subunit alpha n=1 Tax=Propylenella binzhouense TaxID=2555902 RepID=A0A964T7N7_9HYPH|nr:protocatechuate 3,4-dioxygenase subunit alpha [Propylenella binzhouense]MYZ49959.1 protocatechuate 3,4-dioxygenase subunit alpha [Propylenella binzhouense]